MNKFFAALMTLIVIVTIAVVFGLGVMSLGGMSSGDSAGGRKEVPKDALTYGTDYIDWQYLHSDHTTQWRRQLSDTGQPYIRLRQVLTPDLQIHAYELDGEVIARVYHRSRCQPGATQALPSANAETNAKTLLCVGDRAGQTWLRGQSNLRSPALWQEHFDTFSVDIDLAQWDWTAARQLNASNLATQ